MKKNAPSPRGAFIYAVSFAWHILFYKSICAPRNARYNKLMDQGMANKNGKVMFKESFGKALLVWWISITAIYTILYLLFLTGGAGGIWPHIAGFFGLFTPVGILALTLSVFGLFLISNITALAVMGVLIFTCRKIKIEGVTKILLILAILFAVTFVCDLIRFLGSPFDAYFSWAIFVNGEIPEIHGF